MAVINISYTRQLYVARSFWQILYRNFQNAEITWIKIWNNIGLKNVDKELKFILICLILSLFTYIIINLTFWLERISVKSAKLTEFEQCSNLFVPTARNYEERVKSGSIMDYQALSNLLAKFFLILTRIFWGNGGYEVTVWRKDGTMEKQKQPSTPHV